MPSQYVLRARKQRNLDLILSQDPVIASYTLDYHYVAYQTLAGEPTETRRILPGGTILALHPETNKVVPNYTSYNFGPLGVLYDDANCGSGNWEADQVVSVVFQAAVLTSRCWDNGEYGDVLQATKDALAERIQFFSLADAERIF